MNEDPATSLSERIDTLYTSLLGLQEELVVERDALSARDGDALAASNARKLSLVERIDTLCRSLPASLGQLIASAESLTPAEREKLDAVHKSVVELASQTQEYNLVNGRIIARSQQSNRELLASLTGQGAQDTYSSSGQPDKHASGSAIARA